MNFIRDKNGTLVNTDRDEYENAKLRKQLNKKRILTEQENERIKQRLLDLEKRISELEKYIKQK